MVAVLVVLWSVRADLLICTLRCRFKVAPQCRHFDDTRRSQNDDTFCRQKGVDSVDDPLSLAAKTIVVIASDRLRFSENANFSAQCTQFDYTRTLRDESEEGPK